jgi:nucleoid-associated protein
MPVQIIEATIHQLEKGAQTQGLDSVNIHPRPNHLPIDGVLQRLSDSLILMYTKVANSNGTLGVDPIAHRFPVHLKQYLDGGTAFMQFTLETIGQIARKMEDSFLASGGYALFLRYRNDAQDFVLVAMLKLKPGAGIAAGTLDLTETLNIDLAHLNEAARINLTRWHDNQQPYLTFIKGGTRQADISDYFREALACTSYTDSKHHTEALLRAARDFVETRLDLSPEPRRLEMLAMRHRLFDCLDSNREEVPLATIAAAVNPIAPEAFLAHVASRAEGGDGYHLDERIKPNRKTYISLKRVSGKIGTVSLSFDVADVQAERVLYDAGTDSIILKSPNDALKAAILEHAPAPDQPA